MLREILAQTKIPRKKELLDSFPFNDKRLRNPSNEYEPQSNAIQCLVQNQPYSQPTIDNTKKYQNIQSVLANQQMKGNKGLYQGVDSLNPTTFQTNFATNYTTLVSPKSQGVNQKTIQENYNSPGQIPQPGMKQGVLRSKRPPSGKNGLNLQRSQIQSSNQTNKGKRNINATYDGEEDFAQKYGDSQIKSRTRKTSAGLHAREGSFKSSKSKYLNPGDRLQELENYINKIKEGTDDDGNELNKKKKEKAELQTKVDILKSNLRSVNKENRTNTSLKKHIDNENNTMKFLGERAKDEAYYISKDLNGLRDEVESMKEEILELNEETQYYRNEYLVVDKDIMMLKDEIKKCNALIASESKEKEKIQSEISVINKHLGAVDDKITKLDQGSDQFMNDVSLLMKERCGRKKK